MKKIKRLAAMLLLFAMLSTVLPFSSSAQQLEPTQEIAAEAAVTEEDASTEVIALREENVKHFDMGNGVFQALSTDSGYANCVFINMYTGEEIKIELHK